MSAIWIIDQLEFYTLEDLWLCITITITIIFQIHIFERIPVALYYYLTTDKGC